MTMVTRDFNKALKHAESMAMYDLDDQWCVTIRYGTYGSFPLSWAIGRDYHIVCVTIY